MGLTFKYVRSAEEIAAAAQLADEIWKEYYTAIITMEQIDYMIEKFQSVEAITEQIHQEGYQYYLMQREGIAVGYMSVQQQDDKLFLSKFYISKEHRGRGYASQAISFLEKLCQSRRIDHIWLTVNKHNESSIAIYKKKGFRIVREQIADIGNGFVMDDFVMEKPIENV